MATSRRDDLAGRTLTSTLHYSDPACLPPFHLVGRWRPVKPDGSPAPRGQPVKVPFQLGPWRYDPRGPGRRTTRDGLRYGGVFPSFLRLSTGVNRAAT